MTQTLYRFYWDCGRNGFIESLFIADDSDVAKAIGSEVYFGEVLGKHSDISGTLDAADLTTITQNQGLIADLVAAFARVDPQFTKTPTTLCGLNPMKNLQT